MKKVLVFSTAFMFAVINICSAQAEKVESRPTGTATEVTVPSTANQDDAVEPQRPADARSAVENQKPSTDADRPTPKPTSLDADKPTPKPSATDVAKPTPKPASSDAVKPTNVSDSKGTATRNAKPTEPKKRSAEPTPKPKPAPDKKESKGTSSQR